MLIDWRVAAGAAIFCTGVLLTCIETNAQAIPKEVASRVEMHTIPSLTLSDQNLIDVSSDSFASTVVSGKLTVSKCPDPNLSGTITQADVLTIARA